MRIQQALQLEGIQSATANQGSAGNNETETKPSQGKYDALDHSLLCFTSNIATRPVIILVLFLGNAAV